MQQIWMVMGIWMFFLLRHLMIVLGGMRMTGMQTLLGQLIVFRHRLIMLYGFMQPIWTVTATWMFFLLLLMIILLLGMKMMVIPTLLLLKLLSLLQQVEYGQFMQPIWMVMGIWIFFRLLNTMTRLLGMKMMVIQTLLDCY